MGKVIIFSAPSGSGKTTIVHRLLGRYPQLEFSISATSAPRAVRSATAWTTTSSRRRPSAQAVADARFVEWEEVYKGTRYGTLRSEVERIWQKGHIIVFDVDVMGGINLKRASSAPTPARYSSCPPRSRELAPRPKDAARMLLR